MRSTLICLFLLLLAIPPAAFSKDGVSDLLERMDEAAARFEGMTAKVHYITHTAVIDDNSEESGVLMMKRLRANQVQGRIDFTKPQENQRTVTFEERKVQVYTPKIKQLQVVDLGDKGEQIDRFIMLGFGTSGAELTKDYAVRFLGNETLQDKRVIKMELSPKSAEVRAHISKVELWIAERPNGPYPIREKIYDKTPGDYRIVTYSDVQINPRISADALKLKLPAGVKTVYPQK